MSAIIAAGSVLPDDRQSAFLAECAQQLAALPEIGDGVTYRVVAQIQQRYFDPPADGRVAGGKYNRRHATG
jgi:hypothetical protein